MFFLVFAFWIIFFRFSKKLVFKVFLFHPTMVLVLLSASVERCFVSRERDFSSNRPTGPIRSSSHNVCVSVCLCVGLSLFMWYILRPIVPPLPEVGCPKFLEIQNLWGKVMERNGLRIEHFCWEVV